APCLPPSRPPLCSVRPCHGLLSRLHHASGRTRYWRACQSFGGTLSCRPMDDLAQRLAANVTQLRETRGSTQNQMAKLAGVPRATWANLESGAANPTLSVLHRAAAALQVTLEELISTPRSAAKHYPAATVPTKVRGNVTVRKLLPDPIPGMEID